MESHGPAPVRDSAQQIDDNSWLIGNKYILRHVREPYTDDCLLRNSDGSCYTLSLAPALLPATTPLVPKTGRVQLIHDAGDSSAGFKFDNALIMKVKLLRPDVTGLPEHEILNFLAKQQLSFKIPTVLFHTLDGDRTYLIETCMPDKRLNELWWDMNAQEKEHITTRVAEIVSELEVFESEVMTTLDNRWMDPYLEGDQLTGVPEELAKRCARLGMDCSKFVFAHNDLGPTNILVDGDDITVIDWDLAGYYPLQWLRTKFAICHALCPERGELETHELDYAYATTIEKKLEDMGFPEVTAAWKELYEARLVEWIAQRPHLQ
ncbi:kinase-like domain-containing protein [Xylariaceae sp. FL0594]|nr:kinase-like domain-containing protein [Xylariaceae sp. FL0594]